MELSGKIKMIDSTKEVGSAGFKKRDIVVTTSEDYPQDILVQFVKDKCDVLDGYKVGQEVEIGINLRGREWINPKGEAVYFNTIQGWNIKEFKSDDKMHLNQEEQDQFKPAPALVDAPKDDLPF